MNKNDHVVFEPYKEGQIRAGDEYIIADGMGRELHITTVLEVSPEGRFAYSGPTYDGIEVDGEMAGFVVKREGGLCRILLPARVFEEHQNRLGPREVMKHIREDRHPWKIKNAFEAVTHHSI